MLLHFIILFFVLLLGLVIPDRDNRYRSLYLTVNFTVLFILAGFRSDKVGNDTHNYIELFNYIETTGDISKYSRRFEPGYLILNKAVSLFAKDAQVLIVICSFFILFFTARFIFLYSSNVVISTYIYYCYGYFSNSMNTMRICIAITFILLAYESMQKNKLLKFIIFVLLAFSFHRSAIIFLFAWFIRKTKLCRKTVIIMVLFTSIIFVLFPLILQSVFQLLPTYNYYIDSVLLDGKIRFASIINFIVSFSIVIMGSFLDRYNIVITDRFKIKIQKFGISWNEEISLLIFVGSLLVFLSFKFAVIDRIADYFLILSIIYIPNAVNRQKDQDTRKIVYCLLIAFFFIYSTLIHLFRPEWNMTFPYSFFWS